jgi:hypothetical protein
VLGDNLNGSCTEKKHVKRIRDKKKTVSLAGKKSFVTKRKLDKLN